MSGPRSRALDLARALAILSMVAYHFSYDWFVVLGGDGGWPGLWYIHLWQQSICWTFILVSGACGHFGRHPLKKGLILNLCGLLITAVTVVALPSQAVWFGVLNLLGCSVWLLAALRPALDRCPPVAGLAAAFLLFTATYHLQSGWLGWPGLGGQLPSQWYQGPLLVILGMPFSGFVSSDYFPLLPWFCLFCCGYFLWKLPAVRQGSGRLPLPDAGWLSRRSLWIYLAHQPVCMGLAWLLRALAAGI